MINFPTSKRYHLISHDFLDSFVIKFLFGSFFYHVSILSNIYLSELYNKTKINHCLIVNRKIIKIKILSNNLV